MKLEQDEIKKIGVSIVVLAVLLYSYFAFLLDPLQDGERAATSGIASLGPQIADAKLQISKTADLEKKAPEATAFLNTVKSSIPDGAPIAWFPPKMTAFFKSHGIEKCTTHLVSESPDPMPGFRRIVWSVDVPKVEFVPLGVAISSLENQEPLLNILTVSIDATREDAQYQHVTLTLSTLVKS
jgi:hypothetical protein